MSQRHSAVQSRFTIENLSATDLEIFREKSRAFCGSFNIPLDKFERPGLTDSLRQFDNNTLTIALLHFGRVLTPRALK
jgi:hypothetical protein